MSEPSELLDWLQSQNEEGYSDSSGAFSLDTAAAWRKLSSHRLPFDFAWVLKLVQCAFRAGVGLDVRQSWSETVFSWDPSWSCQRRELEQSLLDLSATQSTALQHLAVGLQALLVAGGSALMLEFSDGERAVWDGDTLRVLSTSKSYARFCLRVSHFDPKLPKSRRLLEVVSAKRRRAAIAETLTSLCHWTPFPLTLDGRRINNLFFDPEFGASHLRQPLLYLHAPPQPSLPSFRCPAIEVQPEDRSAWLAISEQEREAALSRFEQPCLALGLVSYFQQNQGGEYDQWEPVARASQFCWVRDGVEVAREDLALEKSPVAILIAASADGLETDLSGLVPRQRSELEFQRVQALRAVFTELSKILSARPQLSYQTKDNSSTHVASALLLGGAVVLANPMMGLLLLCGGVISNFGSKNKASDQEIAVNGLYTLHNALAMLNCCA